MITTNDIIYIKPTSPDVLVKGRTYHVFSVEPVKKKVAKKTFAGYQHRIKAEVKILEAGETYLVGKIKAAFRDVAIGDSIMPLIRRPHELADEKNPAPIDGVLVCSEDNTVMINDHRIAFINRGSRDGIKPGNIYSIVKSQADQSFFGNKDEALLPPLFAGTLIVLHTEENSATIMVLSSTRDIHPGDMVN